MLQYCSVKPKILIFNHVKIAAKKYDLPLMRLNHFNPTK